MAKKKNPTTEVKDIFIHEQAITQTLELNYMPYAMSVIVSRAIPEIDGFKPSHRKLLYTMYLMNLLKGDRTKSSNVVGQTMKLNPHGDGAIYETLVQGELWQAIFPRHGICGPPLYRGKTGNHL